MSEVLPSQSERRVMNASLGVALGLLVAKVVAAAVTSSSAIYSDAAESVTHVVAVAFAAWALRWSHKPSDETHHYGHDKVAFVSSGFEGAMIAAAALLIGYEAVRHALSGVEVASLGLGAALMGGAALVNLALGLSLVRVGKRQGSSLLRANGEHVLADVWTSGAALIALGLVSWTGWGGWDPLFAGAAAVKLLWTGARLMRESLDGLLDAADLKVEQEIKELLDRECVERGLSYHNLRHRHSGRTHWVELHLVFPDELSVREAHRVGTALERRIAKRLEPDGRVITHFEPRSAEDTEEDWEVR